MWGGHFCFANKGIIYSPVASIKLATIFVFWLITEDCDCLVMLNPDKIYCRVIYSPGGNNHFNRHFFYFTHLLASWCDTTSERDIITMVSPDPTLSEVTKNKQKIAKTKTKVKKTMKTLHLSSPLPKFSSYWSCKSNRAVKVLDSYQAVFWYPEVYDWNLSCVIT